MAAKASSLGICLERAGVVAVDGFQGQPDVATALGEGAGLAGVTDLEGGVLGALGDGGQAADCAEDGPGDGVERVEVLDGGDLFPPVVAGSPNSPQAFCKALLRELVTRIGEVGGGELELRAFGEDATAHFEVTGEQVVEFPDAGQAVRV